MDYFQRSGAQDTQLFCYIPFLIKCWLNILGSKYKDLLLVFYIHKHVIIGGGAMRFMVYWQGRKINNVYK